MTMEDRATLTKAKKDLEELYLGVPDDSVNLTFQDLANIPQRDPNKKIVTTSSTSPIMESITDRSDHRAHNMPPKSFAKLPSLDFSKALESSFHSHHVHQHHTKPMDGNPMWGSHEHMYNMPGPHGRHGGIDQRSMVYDDMSRVSGVSTVYGVERGTGRRRPGIPHSNICTVCCNYIYICRNRCLVCGRVYCRQCVDVGMGEMTEGRKCIDCLGRRFSQRYIKKAGSIRCCMGYSSGIKQQELKWAEKGPRRSGENKYNSHLSVMASRTRSPSASPSPLPSMMHSPRNMTPSVLNSPSTMHSLSNPPSFVLNSPYSSRNHHQFMPF